jgi:hypothetical protein
MPTLFRTIVGVAALGLPACGADSAVEPTEYDDVAQLLASSIRPDAGGGQHGAIDDALALAYGALPAGFSVDKFGWVSGRHGDATYLYRVTCADTFGRALPACNSTTDRATVVAAWYGGTSVVAYDQRFNRVALYQLEHLQSGAGTITGSSELVSDAMFGSMGAPITYKVRTGLDEHYLLDNVSRQVFAADLTGDLGGTRNGETLAMAALITLDRDATTAVIVLDGEPVLRVNLDTSFRGE